MPITMSESEADWSTTTTPKSPPGSVTVAAGDYIVLGGVTADQTSTINTPTDGGLTYTQAGPVNIGSNCWLNVWTAPCPSTQTFTFSCSRSATSNVWGYNGLKITGASGGVGATLAGNAAAAPSLSITPQQANSAVVMFIGDWNAADGTSRAYRTNGGTFTEQTYFRDPAQYAVYGGAHLDAGTATSKAFGLTAPSMKYVMILVEMKAGTTPVSMVPVAVRRMGALLQL